MEATTVPFDFCMEGGGFGVAFEFCASRHDRQQFSAWRQKFDCMVDVIYIAAAIEWLGEGKRRNWKYESC